MSENQTIITIDKSNSNQRFDRFLRKYCKNYPTVKLTDIYSAIRKWDITINSRKSKEDYRLQIWDQISFSADLFGKKEHVSWKSFKEKQMKKLTKTDILPRIIYEDADRVAFNKPTWVVAHESNKHRKDLSMNDYLACYTSEYKNWTFKPAFWYRLDKDTSWVLIAAKNYESLQYFNQIIRDREINKEYLTIVSWNPPEHLIINKPLEKSYNAHFDRAQMNIAKFWWLESKTEFFLIKTFFHHQLGQISLLRVKLYTGRMHQIRVHLASEWLPILWDLIYGNPVINRKCNKLLHIQRQLLHCYRYSFSNKDGNLITVSAPLPDDFQMVLGPQMKQISTLLEKN